MHKLNCKKIKINTNFLHGNPKIGREWWVSATIFSLDPLEWKKSYWYTQTKCKRLYPSSLSIVIVDDPILYPKTSALKFVAMTSPHKDDSITTISKTFPTRELHHYYRSDLSRKKNSHSRFCYKKSQEIVKKCGKRIASNLMKNKSTGLII